MSDVDHLPSAPHGGWIQTVTGRAVWPLRPLVDQIDLYDIAHALGMKCRYTGHTRQFYSVAQHSVLASQIVPPADARWALLHDATEAYLPDVARPVKERLHGFRDVEDGLMAVIAAKFGLEGEMPGSIKTADLVLLATERRDLMGTPPYRWNSTENVTPLPERIVPLEPSRALELFVDRFLELFPECEPGLYRSAVKVIRERQAEEAAAR